MVQLLTDGGPPAMVSCAIIDALTTGASAGRSDSVLLCADLIQRAGKHAMLLFMYVGIWCAALCLPLHRISSYCIASLAAIVSPQQRTCRRLCGASPRCLLTLRQFV